MGEGGNQHQRHEEWVGLKLYRLSNIYGILPVGSVVVVSVEESNGICLGKTVEEGNKGILILNLEQ